MIVVDSEGRLAPLWLVQMLANGDDAADEFWASRRGEYRVLPC